MNEALNILIVEDVQADFLLVERHLKRHDLNARCRCVSSLEGFLKATAAGGWDVVLSDYNLPAMDFGEILATCRTRLPGVPLILVSGSIGEERAVELLKLGVWDFILKDNLTRLAPAIEHSLREAAERRARRVAEAALGESEEKFRKIFQASPYPVVIASVDEGRCLDVNNACLTFTGFSHSEVMGKTYLDLGIWLTEEDRDAMWSALTTAGSLREFEARFQTTAGIRSVLVSADRVTLNQSACMLVVIEDITERKLAEDELRIQKEMFERVFENSPFITAIVDRDVRVTKINRAGLAFSGRREEELLGLLCGEALNCLNACHPTGRERNPACADCPIRSKVAHTFRTHESVHNAEGRLTVRRDSGDAVVDLLISTTPLSSHGSEMVLVTLADITERKKGEEALRESESRFKLLSKTAGRLLEGDDPLRAVNELAGEVMERLECQAFFNYVVDDQAGRLRLNAYAGISDEQAREMAWLDYGAAVCGRVARNGIPIVVEAIDSALDARSELVKPCGIQAYASHPLLVGGKVIGTLSFGTKTKKRFSPQDLELMRTVTDQVTIAAERTRFVKALRESEDRFRALFEQAAVGVAQLETPTGRFVTVNDRYCNIVGYSREEMLATTFQELTHPDDLQANLDNMSRLCRNESHEFSMEKRYFHKNGSAVWVNLNVSPLWRPGEEPSFHVAVIEDITERKQAELEQEKLEVQLRQAQKLEALGTLAGGIAHDFNNILSAIMGYTELAQSHSLEGSPQALDLQQVLKAAYRAKDLVGHILTFSRQGPPQELRPIAVGPIMKEALKLLRASLPSTIQISTTISDETGRIMGDPTQLHQVLMNLCTNAAHAMRKKGGELELTLTALELDAQTAATYEDLNEGAYTRLTVKDTGHGMDSATLQRIFDPYFTTKEVGEGTGLGLAVVHGIVKRHGGAITVQSEPGSGTTFEIFFPRIEVDHVKAVPDRSEIPKGTECILFVDDEEVLAELGKRMLYQLGYQVVSKTSSIEALELFRSNPGAFDLVVTDYTMPHMTGAALATEIQQVRRDIPIVLCTGFSEMIDEKRAKEKGIRAFVLKPIDRRNIARVIREVLDKG